MRTDVESARIAGIRELLNFLEANPEAKVPSSVVVYHHADSATRLKADAHGLGGKWDKGIDAIGDYALSRYFSEDKSVEYRIYTPRENVCTPLVVGTKETVQKVATDQQRVDELNAEIDSLMTEVKVTEDVVEWECPPSLAKLSGNNE